MIIKDGVTIVGRTDNKQNELVAGDNITMEQDPNTGKTIISATGGGGGNQFIWKSTNSNININIGLNNPFVVVIKNGRIRYTNTYNVGTIDENLYDKFCMFKPNNDQFEMLIYSGSTLKKTFFLHEHIFQELQNIFTKATDHKIEIMYSNAETRLKMSMVKLIGNKPDLYIEFDISHDEPDLPDGEYNITFRTLTGLRFYHF